VSGRPDLQDLPALVSRGDLAALGLGRRAVDAVCRSVPEVVIPGVRRVYLRRADVLAFIDEHTYPPDRVRG
jgi:hypothetical protein